MQLCLNDDEGKDLRTLVAEAYSNDAMLLHFIIQTRQDPLVMHAAAVEEAYQAHLTGQVARARLIMVRDFAADGKHPWAAAARLHLSLTKLDGQGR